MRMRVLRTKLMAIVITSLMAGCASDDTLALREEPDYARGVGDGCATAREEDKSFSTKRVADEEAFDDSRAYRAGWRQGYFQCQSPNRDRNNGGRILGNENRF